MELRDLKYFLACVDEGHLTRAAQRLHVAQPTLSHALARLEAEAGEQLLQRPRKGRPKLTATAAGTLLERRARRALAEVYAFDDDLAELRGVVRGQLRVGSMQTLNATLLPRPLARFSLAHPAVDISLHTLPAEDIPGKLAEGRIDLGLIAGAPAIALGALQVLPLCREEFVVIVRSDDPLAKRRRVPLRLLAEREFVTVLPHTFTDGLIVEACRMAGFTPKVLLRLESGEAIREVVREGLGITILPAGRLSKRDPSLRAVRLSQPTPKREVQLLFDPRTPPSATARAFMAELVHATNVRNRTTYPDKHISTNATLPFELEKL